MNIQVRQVTSLADVRPPLSWEPAAGDEVLGFIERKHRNAGIPKDALNFVLFEAQQILGRCLNPRGEARQSTGLVVGYVQSGKTLSFTMLSALAHDSGFGLVILVAGTKDNLREQTRDRLRNDLGLIGNSPSQPWVPLNNPAPGSGEERLLARTVANWAAPEVPRHHKKVCLITVLKHHQRLRALRDCLASLDLRNVSVLVIDDEADQASPNTFAAANLARGTSRRSSTYDQILRLKQVLPGHSYVQYTATPQANLLMALNDLLSPEFAESVSPGEGYVGGQQFFMAGAGYVSTIPAAEAAATMTTHPNGPATLARALAIYLLGAAVLEVSGRSAARTMMVHPAQQTQPHKDYLAWITDRLDGWRALLSSAGVDALETIFRPAYDDLLLTAPGLPNYESLMEHLSAVLGVVQVRDVNSTPTGRAPVDWTACAYWILVGGAKLDRGFTVEGLSVTYMPRGLGDGSADSIQQRARFCGYKQGYLGLCRIFLEAAVRQAFEEYVDHEREIHRALESTRGQPLEQWVRTFVLHASMQPTRRNVIGIPLRDISSDNWLVPKAAHRDSASNESVLREFVDHLRSTYLEQPAQVVDPTRFVDKRQGANSNKLFEAVAAEEVERFLGQWTLSDADDAFALAVARLALRKMIFDDGPGRTVVDVFLIGDGRSQSRSRDSGSDAINQVFQGPSPNTTDRTRLTYAGDRGFFSATRPSLHVRRFNLNADAMRNLVAIADAPWFALHIPPSLGKRFILQDE